MSGNAVLAVRELLGYLECPNPDVSEEARDQLHQQLNSINDSWLIAGLLNYFLESNSRHALELIFGAPEHHDKHFLNLVCDGLKKPPQRFRYTCLLFQGLRRNPAPSWLRRLPRHTSIMKELLFGFDNSTDVTSMVASVAVVVTLVTAVPHDMARYCLGNVLEMFWRMLNWTPKPPQDSTFTDFLRLTLYTLFTRLYSLFPCNVVNFIRRQTINADNRAFFMSTLKPMVERVRLHPMLFSFTKEQEVDSKLHIWRDQTDVLMQCSRVTLDPEESTCEEPPVLHDPEVCKASFVEGTKCWVHASLDTFFWSPSHIQSPNPLRVDLPPSNMHTPHSTPLNTPIYTRTPLRLNVSLSIPESPPEAGVEATPETTPYTTPLLSDISRQMRVQSKPGSSNKLESNRDMKMLSSNVSNSGFFEPKKSSVMLSKIDALQKERELAAQQALPKNVLGALDNSNSVESLKQPLNDASSSSNLTSPPGVDQRKNLASTSGQVQLPDLSNLSIENNQSNASAPAAHVKFEGAQNIVQSAGEKSKEEDCKIARRRKKSVFKTPDVDMLEFTKSSSTCDSPSPGAEHYDKFDLQTDGDKRNPSLEKSDEETRKVSTESKDSGEEEYLANDDERGLGPPSGSSISALVKTAKSNRLRFLSQCGPPLDEDQIDSIMPEEKRSKNRSGPFLRLRSKSCTSFDMSSLDDDHVESPSATQASMLPRLPSTVTIDRFDVGTQTVTSASVDPYEKLIETFVSAITLPAASSNNVLEQTLPEFQSPHLMLRNYIQRKIIDTSDPLPNFDFSRLKTPDEKLKSQIYSMYSLLMLERHKREIHAHRNRSLLAKTKRMHVFIEEKKGLCSKMEAYQEDTRNLKSSNLYMSSCYQRMKDSRDRENAEKDALLKDYSEGKKLQLTETILATLSRGVKTSKGQESKDVVVLIHRPVDSQQDALKDELLSVASALMHNLRHVCDERQDLRLKISVLEQNVSRHRNNEDSMELVLKEKELIRQRMSVIMTRLTILEELNLELQERVHSLENELSDTNSKQKLASMSWQSYKEKSLSEKRAMRGLTSAAALHLNQLRKESEEKDKLHEEQIASLKQSNDAQRRQIQNLENELRLSQKESEDLRYSLSQEAARREVFKKELEMLRSRSGYSRSCSNNKQLPPEEESTCDNLSQFSPKSFLNSAISSDLKPLPSEPPPSTRNKK
ncbi:hamartin [Hyalella azteca]|uniref:Hamartin n=1 Tax=Hyalella azteca TaxID=294128 RepID=A0A8B7P6F0_HYAAZ|nr:hamartin [Hyalella azteca]